MGSFQWCWSHTSHSRQFLRHFVVLLLVSVCHGAVTQQNDGSVLPVGLQLKWPFKVGELVEVMNVYTLGDTSHRGTAAVGDTTRDSYALDLLLPQFVANGRFQPVFPVADGTVVASGWSRLYPEQGIRVIVEHVSADSERFYSLYAHLHSVVVTVGLAVNTSNPLGRLGSSANFVTEGVQPHLHFAMYYSATIATPDVPAVGEAGFPTDAELVIDANLGLPYPVKPEPMSLATGLKRGAQYRVPTAACMNANVFCQHGDCVPEAGTCTCDEHWGGPSCTQRLEYCGDYQVNQKDEDCDRGVDCSNSCTCDGQGMTPDDGNGCVLDTQLFVIIGATAGGVLLLCLVGCAFIAFRNSRAGAADGGGRSVDSATPFIAGPSGPPGSTPFGGGGSLGPPAPPRKRMSGSWSSPTEGGGMPMATLTPSPSMHGRPGAPAFGTGGFAPSQAQISADTSARFASSSNGSKVNIPGNHQIGIVEMQLDEEIGRGAYGVVFSGFCRGSKVAIKQLDVKGGTESPDYQSQLDEFQAEAEFMITLPPHPNVVRLVGVTPPPNFWIVIEYLDKGSLYGLLHGNKTIDPTTQLNICKGIASGMAHLHKHKVIHRDLAARNILLDATFTAKISDFGLSRFAEADENKTKSDVGPIKWMSPESIKDKVYSDKSDVWSFGVTLWEVLTRKNPYPQMDLITVATKVCFPADVGVALASGVQVPIGEVAEGDGLSVVAWGGAPEGGDGTAAVPGLLTTAPGQGKAGRVGTVSRHLVTVRLQDGQSVRCTPAHQLATAGRGWVSAVRLVPGQDAVRTGMLLPVDTAAGEGSGDTHAHERLVQAVRSAVPLALARSEVLAVRPAALAVARLAGLLVGLGVSGGPGKRGALRVRLGSRLDRDAVLRDVASLHLGTKQARACGTRRVELLRPLVDALRAVTPSVAGSPVAATRREFVAATFGQTVVAPVLRDGRMVGPVLPGRGELAAGEAEEFVRTVGVRYAADLSMKLSAAVSVWRRPDGVVCPVDWLQVLGAQEWFASPRACAVAANARCLPTMAVPVASVVDEGEVAPVYDVAMPAPHHSFVASSMVVHNCYNGLHPETPPGTDAVYVRILEACFQRKGDQRPTMAEVYRMFG